MQPERPATRLRALLDTQEPRPASRLRALVAAAWEPDPADPHRERRALPGGGFEYRARGGSSPEPPPDRPLSAPPPDPALAAKRAELARIKAGGDINRGPVAEPSTGDLLKRYGNMVRGGMTEGADFLLNLPETAARAVTEPFRKAAVEAAPVFGSGVQGAMAQRFGLEDPAYRAEMASRVKEKRGAQASPPPEGLSLYGAPEIVDETLQNAREERERLARETMDDQIARGASPTTAALMTTYGPRFTGNLLDPTMLLGGAEGRLAARAEKAAPVALEATIGRSVAESPAVVGNVEGRLAGAAEHALPAAGPPERPAMRLRALVEDAAPPARPPTVPDDFADLYRTAMNTAPPASEAVAPRAQLHVEHGPPLDGKPVLLARDAETGDTVGRLVYDRAPGGGFTVHMVETEGRGTGAARQLYKTAAATEGPYRGSVIRTGEGDALVSRLRETDPGIFGEPAPAGGDLGGALRPEALPAGGGGAADAGGLPHGLGPGGDPGAGAARPPQVAVTERGTRIGFDYEVREASDLITSHDEALRPNANYPQALQPRDRTRLASEAQVGRIERQLNPELLGESPHASNGAPILGPDGIVESGNARSIALKRAYRGGTPGAAEYRAWLEGNASRFGVDPGAIANMREPVLVRVRNTPVDRVAFAAEANEAPQAVMSATERAAVDARRITPAMVDSLRIPETGEVNFQAHRDFVRAFARGVGPNELGSLFDARGMLSAEGRSRIQNALLSKAYGDPGAVAQLIEHADNNVRNVGVALLREAPRYARLREAVSAGALHPLDISADLSAALRKLSALRESGQRVPEYLAQGGLFGSELSPEARVLLATFDANARSSAKLSDILRRYAELAEGAGHPQQVGLFGSTPPPSALELLREAVTADNQGALFAMAEPPPSAVMAELAPPAPAPPPPAPAPGGGLFAGLDEPPVVSEKAIILPPARQTPRPPVEAPPTLPGLEDGATTSLKNAVTVEERAGRGLPEVERQAAMRSGSGWEEARQIYQEDPEAARALAKEVAAKPRSLSPAENDLLLHDRMALTLQHREALAAEETALASGDTPAITQARLRRTAIEDALNANDEAAARAGTAWSASGRERQLLIREDYSPARLFQRARVAGGGAPLPPAVEGRLAQLSAGIEEAAAAETAAEERSLAQAGGQAVEAMRRDAAAVARKAGRAVSREALGAEFDALSREFGRKAQTPRTGLDPDLVVLIGKMARNRVRAGVVELEEVVDHVYQAIRPHLETLTRRDVMEAISGYGKTSQPNADEVAARLREIKAQGRLVLALEDAEAGTRPLKTGYQRGPDSSRVRALRQRVNEAMRANGVTEMMSPARQMRTGVDAARTRLERQIADLNRFISTGERPGPRTPASYPEELQQLVAERDRLKGVLSEMDGAGLTEEQRVRIAERVAERRVQDLQRKVAAGEIEPKPTPPPVTSPRLQALHQQQDALAQQLRDLREAAGIPERGRLKAYKARLAKQEDEAMARLEELRAGVIPAKKAARSPVKLDTDALAARARVQGLRQEADKIIRRLELAQRGPLHKAADFTSAWARFLPLTSTATIQKLGAAASSRVFVFRPLEEVLGVLDRRLPVVKEFARAAKVEGGHGGFGPVAKSWASAFGDAARKEIKANLKGQTGPFDLAMGKAHYDAGLPPKLGAVLEYPGHLHAAAKAPAKIAAYEFAMERQAARYLEQGHPAALNDPAAIAEMKAVAWEYANREILQGDNALVTRFNRALADMPGQSTAAKIGTTAVRTQMPLVKVATNYPLQATDYLFGLPKAAYRMGKVIAKGSKEAEARTLAAVVRAGLDASPAGYADMVMRQLKRGQLGAVLVGLGATGAIEAGGYYRKGDHRGHDDLQPGEIRIGGKEGLRLPHIYLHGPALEALQVGATLHRARTLTQGVGASTLGLLEQTPFADEIFRLSDAREDPTKLLGGSVRSLTVPPDVVQRARVLDQRGDHTAAQELLQQLGFGGFSLWGHGVPEIEAKKRKARGGFMEQLQEEEMLGIPGLRQKVR